MYLIACDYGTRQIAWTMRNALSWMAACGPDAYIINRFTGRVLRRRQQYV